MAAGGTTATATPLAEEEVTEEEVEVGIILTMHRLIMAILIRTRFALSTRFRTVISLPFYPVHPPW